MMKNHAKKRAARIAKVKSASYEIDIAQEFKDVKQEIAGLKNEISGWQKTVEKQLSKLNDNMERVLNTIAEHEGRITKLEQDALKQVTRRETMTDMAKFGWIAAKILLAVGAIIGSVGGCGWILKLLQVI